MFSSSANLGLSIYFYCPLSFSRCREKCKNKCMGNCISKINKDPFLVYEEVIKNDLLLFERVLRRALDMGANETYTDAHCLIRSQK